MIRVKFKSLFYLIILINYFIPSQAHSQVCRDLFEKSVEKSLTNLENDLGHIRGITLFVIKFINSIADHNVSLNLEERDIVWLATKYYFTQRFPELFGSRELDLLVSSISNAVGEQILKSIKTDTAEKLTGYRIDPAQRAVIDAQLRAAIAAVKQKRDELKHKSSGLQFEQTRKTHDKPATYHLETFSSSATTHDQSQVKTDLSHLDKLNEISLLGGMAGVPYLVLVDSNEPPFVGLIENFVGLDFKQALHQSTDNQLIKMDSKITTSLRNPDDNNTVFRIERTGTQIAISHEWGHLQYIANLIRLLDHNDMGDSIDVRQTIVSQLIAHIIVQELIRSGQVVVHTSSAEQNFYFDTFKRLFNAYSSLCEIPECKARLKKIELIFNQTIACQEVYADLAAIIDAAHPSALAAIMPENSWDAIVRDFLVDPSSLLSNPDFRAAQYADPHLRLLLRHVILDHYYTKKNALVGISNSHDAEVLREVFDLLVPGNLSTHMPDPTGPTARSSHDDPKMDELPDTIIAAAKISNLPITQFLKKHPWVILRILQIPKYQESMKKILKDHPQLWDEAQSYFDQMPEVLNNINSNLAEMDFLVFLRLYGKNAANTHEESQQSNPPVFVLDLTPEMQEELRRMRGWPMGSQETDSQESNPPVFVRELSPEMQRELRRMRGWRMRSRETEQQTNQKTQLRGTN